MSPDVSQSLTNTIYAIFAHNYLVIAYVLGAIIAACLVLIRPNRFHLILLFGFASLAFGFEYDKHIIEPFRNQTLVSMATAKPHFKVNQLIDSFIGEILPMLFYLFGWGMIFLAMILGGKNKKKEVSE